MPPSAMPSMEIINPSRMWPEPHCTHSLFLLCRLCGYIMFEVPTRGEQDRLACTSETVIYKERGTQRKCEVSGQSHETEGATQKHVCRGWRSSAMELRESVWGHYAPVFV